MLGDWQVTNRPGAIGSVALQLVITAWAGLRLARISARGEARPFAIVFWLYVYVWLGLTGLLQVIHQTAPWPISINPSAFQRGQIVILLGIAALEIGHLFPKRIQTPSIESLEPVSRRIVGSRVTMLVAFVFLTAPLWYQELGGLHSLFTSREELKETIYASGRGGLSLATGGIIISLATVPSFLALYAVIVTRQYKLWRNRSRLIIVILAAIAFVLNSPIAAPRFWVATMLIALIFAIPLVQKRAMATRTVVVAALVGSIVLFPYAAFFRYSSGFKQPPGITQTLITKPDYDSFEMITAGVQYTMDTGHLDGKQLLSDLFFFVPRALWPTKAQDTGAVIASHNNLAYTNLSAPLWIEMYIDFGYLGVVIMFFLYGRLMRRADDRFVRGDSPLAQFMIPLLAGYSCILLRGALLQSMARLAVMLAIMWMISARSKSSPNSTSATSARFPG